MTEAEREEFLADLHVGIVAVDEPGRGPLSLPIWYVMDGRDVVMRISEGSVKHRLLEAAGRATLTVQTETAPYKYVSVEGPIITGPATSDGLEMATRYLGPELGQWYVDNAPSEDIVDARLRPEHWRSHDFAKEL
jgi:Pyridoxamine 5'-phosphate oxidase